MIKSLGSLRLNWWPGFLIENYGPLENWTICLLSETLLLLLPRNKVIIYPFSTIYSGNLLTLKFHSNITIDTISLRKQHLEATLVKLLWKSRCVSLGQLPGQIKSWPSHQTPRLEWVFCRPVRGPQNREHGTHVSTNNLPPPCWNRQCPLLFLQATPRGISPPPSSLKLELHLLLALTRLVLYLPSVAFLILQKLGMPLLSGKDLTLTVFISMTWEFQLPTNKHLPKGSLFHLYFQRQVGSWHHFPYSCPLPEDGDPIIWRV